MKRLIGAVVAVMAVASLWYLVAPPRTPDAYRERAAQTAQSLRSHVQTARLWAQAEARGRVTHQATTIALEEAEHDAEATASSFSAYDPPAGTSDLRTRITRASGDVTDALAALRIAAHGEAWRRVRDAQQPLQALAARLDRLAREARP